MANLPTLRSALGSAVPAHNAGQPRDRFVYCIGDNTVCAPDSARALLQRLT